MNAERKMHNSIIRCMVMDIRDGQMGTLAPDAKSIYHRLITLMVTDNIDLINEQIAQVDKNRNLTVEEVVSIYFEKA